jgi:hypothetical protein
MATSKIKGLDEALLEGGGGGGGAGIGGTKWSNIPSFKGKSNTLSDINKMMSETSHLKGGAKQAVEEAKARAANRTAVRAAGAATVGAGAKSMMPESATAKSSSGDDGVIEAAFRKSEAKEEPSEMATHYKPDNYKKGGKVTASSRADGIAQRGKTRGKMC